VAGDEDGDGAAARLPLASAASEQQHPCLLGKFDRIAG